MKVRLVKKEDLMKATSRANLVKVAVQVNGRTGQYSSHRWKNPGAALNVLKETMKRAGVKPTDELEFKNKKTNKTLNEDELIKDYKQSKTTDTLQDFVKKNYTVSKAKEEKVKEEKPKANTKKKTYQEENPKSEKKDVEDPDDVDKLWFENVELDGSVKQKNWAEDIRRDFYNSYQKILEKTKGVTPKDSLAEKRLTGYARDILSNTSSRDWIDNRDNTSPESILKNVYEITAMETLFSDREFKNLKDKLPTVIGIDSQTEELRTKIIESSLSTCYDKLSELVRSPQTTEPNENAKGFIDSTLAAMSNSDTDYWAGVTAFFEGMAEEKGGNKPPVKMFNKKVERFFKSKKELEPKLLHDVLATSAEDAREKRSEALKTRSYLSAQLLRAEKLIGQKERLEDRGKTVDESKYKEIDGLTRESLETARKMFETEVSQSYWNDIADKGVDSIQGLLKEDTTEADLEAYEVIFRSHSNREKEAREARHKNATRIDSKGDYKEIASYGDLKKNLSLLKDSKTEVVGRAAMDMVGLTSPLYVNKEAPFVFGERTTHGYCEYDFSNPDNTNNVAEIGVVDYKENRQQSFKTSIHESMHGVFSNIKLSDGSLLAKTLAHKNNEGMVEIIGQATTKAAYGDKYKDPIPSYLPFVVDTALRLRSRDEFKGKSVHQIGEYLGEKAIAKDAKYFEELSGFLDKNKRVGLRGNVVKELSKNTDKVDAVAKQEHERSGKGDFEKSNLANLVEQMKAGLITLQGALNSSQYKNVAVVLLYRLLEEDEEAAETLSAFQ